MKITIITIIAIFVMACLPTTADAGIKQGPPSINLRSNLANISIAELTDIKPGNELVFKKIKDLHNQSDAIIKLKSTKHLTESLQLNKYYIIAYIAWKKSRPPVKVSRRKDGPVLISIVGATPAIFAFDKNIEKLITWNLSESLTSPSQMLPIIMQGINNTDVKIQTFFVTELVTRRNIHKHLKPQDFEKIISILKSPKTATSARYILLSHLHIIDKHLSPQQLFKVLMRVLSESQTNFDAYALDTEIIRLALVQIRKYKKQVQFDDLKRWLFSNNTGIIEETLDSLRIIKPKSYLKDLDTILNNKNLTDKPRKIITSYIKRIKRGNNVHNN